MTGVDVEIGVCDGAGVTVGVPAQIQPTADLYDFDAKYGPAASPIEAPADFDAGLTGDLMEAARIAYLAAECRGFARVDFLVDADRGNFVVNEVNTIPYVSADSSFNQSLLHGAKVRFAQLLLELVCASRDGGR